MNGRARVFIGSASESLHVAEALQTVLGQGPDVEVTLWPDVFNLGEYPVDDLRAAAELHEFAVFVFSPDDAVSSRETEMTAPRDNVIFELGLFSFPLGSRRTFVVKAEGESVKVPSDLAGLTYATYKAPNALPSDARWESAVRSAARRIRRAIDQANRADLPVRTADVSSIPASRAPSELLADDLAAAARQGRLPPLTLEERVA